MTDMRVVIKYRQALIDAMALMEETAKSIRELLKTTEEKVRCEHYCGAAECYIDWDEFHCKFEKKTRGKGSL